MKHFLSRLHGWWSSAWANKPSSSKLKPPVLLVVEGINDIYFLKNISAILSRIEPALPDLRQWELDGHCFFIAIGGDVANWATRLAALPLPQVHLYDRETGPVTDSRRAHVALLNLSPHVSAFLTGKRALENYLHAEAVRESLGIDIVIDDDTPVAEAAAQAILHRANPCRSWDTLPLRSRKRRRDRAKRLLNSTAVLHMNAVRLAERDPQKDLDGWLRAIARLSHSTERLSLRHIARC